jgi:C-terminal processing protease CtpA/Prc
MEAYLEREVDILNKSKDKGFLPVRDNIVDLGIDDLWGRAQVKKVIVLSDTYCRNAGEVFVQTCKISSKVTVVGRPTLGSTDYANSNVLDFDLYSLSYLKIR